MSAVVVRTTLLPVASNVFRTFAWRACMREQERPDFLWAALCLVGAVYFMFRGRGA